MDVIVDVSDSHTERIKRLFILNTFLVFVFMMIGFFFLYLQLLAGLKNILENKMYDFRVQFQVF